MTAPERSDGIRAHGISIRVDESVNRVRMDIGLEPAGNIRVLIERNMALRMATMLRREAKKVR